MVTDGDSELVAVRVIINKEIDKLVSRGRWLENPGADACQFGRICKGWVLGRRTRSLSRSVTMRAGIFPIDGVRTEHDARSPSENVPKMLADICQRCQWKACRSHWLMPANAASGKHADVAVGYRANVEMRGLAG